MKKLNQHSTKIFSQLLNKLRNKQHIQLTIEDYMPLTLELVRTDIKTPFGVAKLYSLMHHFRQNGDLMRDPEMTFLVIEEQNATDHNKISVFPQSYQLDPLGIYEESVTINDNHETIGYLFRYQGAHCAFANLWLANIKEQGFLK